MFGFSLKRYVSVSLFTLSLGFRSKGDCLTLTCSAGVSLILNPAGVEDIPAQKIVLGSSEELLPSTCLSPPLLVGETSNFGAGNVPPQEGRRGQYKMWQWRAHVSL